MRGHSIGQPLIPAARMVLFAAVNTTLRRPWWEVGRVRVTEAEQRRLSALAAGDQRVCTLRFADAFCVRHGLPLDELLSDGPVTALYPTSRWRPAPCPCGCGTRGLCDAHRARLHAICDSAPDAFGDYRKRAERVAARALARHPTADSAD